MNDPISVAFQLTLYELQRLLRGERPSAEPASDFGPYKELIQILRDEAVHGEPGSVAMWWDRLKESNVYAGLAATLAQGWADDPNRSLLGLTGIMSALAYENTSVQVQQMAMVLIRDAAALDDTDLMRLTEALRQTFNLKAGWIRAWQKAVKSTAKAQQAAQKVARAIPPVQAGAITSAKSNEDLYTATQRWAAIHRDTWGYDMHLNTWRQWTGTHWTAISTRSPKLDTLAIQVLQDASIPITSQGRMDSVIRLAATECARVFVHDGRLVAFRNGTLDTATGMSLDRHDRDTNLTMCLPYDYTAGPTPIIDRVLHELTNDPIAGATLRTHIGLALLRDTTFHRVIILLGPPGSGKTLILDLVNKVLGMPERQYAPGLLYSSDREGSLQRAICRDWHITVMDEFPTTALKNEDYFKIMSAHGSVDSRQHHAPPVNAQWLPKALIAANDIPVFTDKTGAIRRRLIVISCPNVRAEADFDRTLGAKMDAELGAFAMQCLDAAHAARLANAYPTSRAMQALYDDLVADNDPVKAFVAEGCVLTIDNLDRDGAQAITVYSAALHTAYKNWADDNGHREMSNSGLSRRIVHYAPWHIAKDRDKNGIRLHGIGLAQDYPLMRTGNMAAFERLAGVGNVGSENDPTPNLGLPDAANVGDVGNVGFFTDVHMRGKKESHIYDHTHNPSCVSYFADPTYPTFPTPDPSLMPQNGHTDPTPEKHDPTFPTPANSPMPAWSDYARDFWRREVEIGSAVSLERLQTACTQQNLDYQQVLTWLRAEATQQL